MSLRDSNPNTPPVRQSDAGGNHRNVLSGVISCCCTRTAAVRRTSYDLHRFTWADNSFPQSCSLHLKNFDQRVLSPDDLPARRSVATIRHVAEKNSAFSQNWSCGALRVHLSSCDLMCNVWLDRNLSESQFKLLVSV